MDKLDVDQIIYFFGIDKNQAKDLHFDWQKEKRESAKVSEEFEDLIF